MNIQLKTDRKDAPMLIGLLALLVMGATAWSLWHGVHNRTHALWLGGFRLASSGEATSSPTPMLP